ncbi:hypothetical protein D1B33_14545 [Lysinibacillus yapensis]|uniref:Uncharacterized protein n=1 Tax=Ureibacillus yapensis TaxID=2304605 RepID=A0A396S4E7_9BACL|nr:hypothetical protein [Lysinibacillus yapensis]RHW34016.1 hypothetical protein D1B33_14545 [Lysinibacillus yapensis]
MVVNIIFPIFALSLFMIGIWMGSMIDPLFGLIAILGGSLLGFSTSFKNGTVMNKKSRLLLLASFIFMLSLMSLAYLAILHFISSS